MLHLKRFIKFTALLTVFGLFIVFFWWRLFSPNPAEQHAEQAIEALPTPKPIPSPIVVKDPSFADSRIVSDKVYIRIPAIDLTFPIAEGIDENTLQTAVGHYPHTGTPEQYGNFALAGHDCCHSNGEPLRYMYKLKEGDAVIIDTPAAEYIYRLVPMPQCGSGFIQKVNYKDVKVIYPEPCTTENTRSMRKLITLTTCTPYGAEWTPDRLVVWGKLTEVKVR